MKKLLLSLLLLASTVIGQEQLFQIRDFKGLNTVAGDFAVQPNEARLAHNIDFGRNVGSITKRYGYDSISTMSGMDSIVAIYGAYYSDGTQQLVLVADIDTFGYGAVYVTPKGSVNLDSLTKIWDYWSVFGYPSFTMFDDAIYIVNGYSRGLVYYDGIARGYPAKAPGEPTIVPLNDAGNVDGEYRYVFYASDTTSGVFSVTVDTTIDSTCYFCGWYLNGDCVSWKLDVDCSSYDSVAYDTTIDSSLSYSAKYQSVVSDKIIVKNGQVLLTEFQFPNTDSVFTSYPNGFRLTIARTLANSGRLTKDTKIYYVTDFLLPSVDSAKRYIYIDTSSDATLTGLYASLDVAIDISNDGRDDTGVVNYRYGSPRYVSQVNGGASGTYGGIMTGIPKQKDTLGVAYTCTFIDTVTGIESDTGRTLFVFCDDDSIQSNISISLPRLTADDSGIVINLYRSLIRQITYEDSTYSSVNNPLGGGWLPGVWVSFLAVDTVVTNEFFLQGQYTQSDTIVTDSIQYDSLVTRRQYTKSTPPDIFNAITSANNRLLGIYGSRLYRSQPLSSIIDTIQTWGQLEFQTFNEFDGDIGTMVFQSRTATRFFKNFSSFNAYDDFSKSEVSNTIGCIAPKSYASGTGGHYYLSKAGVIYETDGQQLERTFNTNLVSQKIRNLDNYDITELSDAYGTYFNRKYMLTVGDTTYVFDERSGEWSTWSLPIASATKYGTESSVTFIPGDTLYFIKPGGSTIYRYGTSEYDNYRAGVDSTNIQWLWQSPPLFTDFREVAVNSIGMWCNSTTTGDSIGVLVIDEEGVTAGSAWYKNLSQRYFKNGVSTDKGKYFTLKLGTASDAVDIGSTYIDGLDIFYKIISNTQIE